MELAQWQWAAAAEALSAVVLTIVMRKRGGVVGLPVWTLFWTQAVSVVVFAAGTPPNPLFPLFVLPAAFLLTLRWINPFAPAKLFETDSERAYRYRSFSVFRRKRLEDVERP